MNRINIAGRLALSALLGSAFSAFAFAQTTPVSDQPVVITAAQTTPVSDQPIVITVETTDSVLYRGDTFDITKIAKSPGMTTSVNQAFVGSVQIADVRTVNGQPAKGIWSYQVVMALPFRANPQPGQAISDVDSGGYFQCVWQIVSTDGKYIGTLYDVGASPSPDHTVMGGSGAFLGATGVDGMMQGSATMRGASNLGGPRQPSHQWRGKSHCRLYPLPKVPSDCGIDTQRPGRGSRRWQIGIDRQSSASGRASDPLCHGFGPDHAGRKQRPTISYRCANPQRMHRLKSW